MNSDEQAAATVQGRLDAVRERIAAACARSHRTPSSITVVTVTKTAPLSMIEAAYAAGLRDFGENYVQESLAKLAQARALSEARWHFIGHLQRNKARAVCGRFALIQSIDSLALAERIARIASEVGAVQDVLVQVKLGTEPEKSGANPSDTLRMCEAIAALGGIRLLGLMAIAPLSASGDAAHSDPRPHFATARVLFEKLPPAQRQFLSLGMSADFEAAVEEGSTMLRIGAALLGPRNELPASR